MSDSKQKLCLGTAQSAILSALTLGAGECPICHQSVRVDAVGTAYAHLAAPAPSAPEGRKSGTRCLLTDEQIAIAKDLDLDILLAAAAFKLGLDERDLATTPRPTPST